MLATQGGVTQDFPLAQMWVDAPTLRIADGPDEVHKMTIARRERKTHDAGLLFGAATAEPSGEGESKRTVDEYGVQTFTVTSPDGVVDQLVIIPQSLREHDKILATILKSHGYPGDVADFQRSSEPAGGEAVAGYNYGFTWCNLRQTGYLLHSVLGGPVVSQWTHRNVYGQLTLGNPAYG